VTTSALRPALRIPRASLGPLNLAAWFYWLVVVAPAALGIPLAAAHAPATDWLRFALLTALASRLSSSRSNLNRRRVFHPAIVFVVAGALLLPPELLILLIVVHCIPDWLKQRYPWYIATFNIANYVTAGVAAWAVAQGIGFPASAGREAVAGALAASVFVLTNRLLLMPMLYLGRGLTPRQAGLLDGEDFTLELVLSLMAVPLAAFWTDSIPLRRSASPRCSSSSSRSARCSGWRGGRHHRPPERLA
jgi:hypothetical protein